MMTGVKKFYIVFAMTLFYLVEIQGSPIETDNGFILSGITDLQCNSNNDCSGLSGHQCCWFPGHGNVCSDTFVDDFKCFDGPLSALQAAWTLSSFFGRK